jgi:CBS domain-containing protein
MKIKEIMIKDVVTVNPQTPVSEVAKMLFEKRFHGIPVVDDEKKLLGIITEGDFFVKDSMMIFLPNYIDFLEKAKITKELPDGKKEEVEELLSAKAEDIMTKECFFVQEETDILELIKTFQKGKFFTMPVVDKDEKVVGIVTVADIISLIH